MRVLLPLPDGPMMPVSLLLTKSPLIFFKISFRSEMEIKEELMTVLGTDSVHESRTSEKMFPIVFLVVYTERRD